MALATKLGGLFFDQAKVVITSRPRLDGLIASGLAFEACAAQTLAVEALLFLATMLKATDRDLQTSEQIRTGLSKLTFGQILRRAQKENLLPTALAAELDAYVQHRNFLVHRLHPQNEQAKNEEIYAHGNRGIDELLNIIRPGLDARLRAAGVIPSPWEDR